MKTKEERQTKKTYNDMAQFYHEHRTTKFEDGWFFNEYLEMPAMIKALGNVRGKKLLDWGCGSGIYAKVLNRNGAIIKGFDISEEMIKIAKKDNPDLDLRVGSGLKIPFNEKFDIVFASLALHYLKDWNKAFKEVSRVLKKDGVFLFSDDNPVTKSSKSMIHENKKIKALGIRNYFKEGEMHYADWKLPNGKTVRIRSYAKTYESIIKMIIKNNFEIIDYVDVYPIPSAKSKFPEEFSLWSKVPKFVIWKLKKK